LVEVRDTETWRGLLGDDGYALALRLQAETAEPFDQAATRVWTLIEAGKKAASLKRFVPEDRGSLGGPWQSFVSDNGDVHLDYTCGCLSTTVTEGLAVFSVAVERGQDG
jgi:hypothetical protein